MAVKRATRDALTCQAIVAVTSATAAVAACSDEQPAFPDALQPAPIASINAPLSFVDDIALVTDTVACVADSYEFQVHCLSSSGGTVGIFGRSGEGPGEFRGVGRLERADGGNVAVLDIRLDRATVFSTDGTLLWEASAPGIYMRELVGEHVYGYTRDRSADDVVSVPTGLDLRSGEVVWTGHTIARLAEDACIVIGGGAMSPDGTWVSWNCNQELVVFDDSDGLGDARLSPAYSPEFPNDRDVDEYLEGVRNT
ncbi:MAG: hypothetical protein OXI83_09205 [Gemmatimonadota bacterium]|nr:hypothetical protein [Gemmatimonadota bacterium]